VVPSSDGSSPEVSGVVIPRTLPRTGIDPGFLLMLGGMFLVSGVLLLRYADDTA
jgi:LPXTG-motif cell wall-anchored protein